MSAVPFDEATAAVRLGVSKATLSRERLAERIVPIRIGQRIIRYTDEILDEYRRRCPLDTDEAIAKAKACRRPFRKEHGVYFLWLADEIVYVGITSNFYSRMANHIFRKAFDGYSFMPAPLERLAALEAALIDRLKPRLNILLNSERATVRRTGGPR